MGDVIPSNVFAEALEKKRDPKGYAGRKIHEAIDLQVKAKDAAEPLLIGEVPLLAPEHDETPIMDRSGKWGTYDPYDQHFERQRLLNAYMAERWRREQSDPGDEIDE